MKSLPLKTEVLYRIMVLMMLLNQVATTSPRRDISVLLREHSCRSRWIHRNPCFVSSEFSACFHIRKVPLQQRKFEAMLKYSSHSASFVEADEKKLIAPFFPIYYNDVYEVNLHPGHRFPMGKYREVRMALQSKIDALSQDEQNRVDCGEWPVL